MVRRFLTAALAVLAAVTSLAQAPVNLDRIGPAVGAVAPAFTLPDAGGTAHTLRSLLGPNGALLVFSRSADW